MYSLSARGKDLFLEISPEELDLSVTLDCGQCFRFRREEDGCLSGVAGSRTLRLSQGMEGVLFYDMTQADFQAFWAGYFDLDTDYQRLKQSYSREETLRRAVEYAGGIRLLRQDRFEMLISFLISQNNNIPRIKASIERLCRRFGEPLANGAYAFPSPERMAAEPEGLTGLGLGYRDGYLVDCAQKIAGGELDLEAVQALELDRAREALRTIKGVGPKVAECVLLFGFHRLEAFPVDTWMKKALSRYYPGGLPEEFRETLGIAQQFLFHYIRTCKDAA